MTTPPTVAVIGGGPGGMFFCHALETYRRELIEKGDHAALAALPVVTCFEKAAGPGGVWRAERTFASAASSSFHSDEEKKAEGSSDENEEEPTTNMYEALWTNAPKEGIEFFDYTFDEHFGCRLPVYMPRQAILEYMIARVTRNCSDFMEKYIKFDTKVESVKYVEAKRKFEVVTKDMQTSELTTQEFDKCIWAAGDNGRPNIPSASVKMFREGGFKGRIVHSSDTANFEQDVKGKRVLLIGGGLSAEDLALMAIKVGVEKVYVSYRHDIGEVSSTSAWPQHKVEVMECVNPVKVTEGGRCIQFVKTEWHPPNEYQSKIRIRRELRDIDTIIFCTGYFPNLEMLDEPLRKPMQDDVNLKVSVPNDWKMTKNKMTKYVGEVTPGDVRWIGCVRLSPLLYRCLSVANPSMMFLTSFTSHNPLTAIDVTSWMLLHFLTGQKEIPSKEEMARQIEEEVLTYHLQNPFIRYFMDANYYDAIEKAWLKRGEIVDEIWDEYNSKAETDEYRFLARAIQEADYPVSYGTFDQLNKKGKTITKYGYYSYYHRAKLDPNNKRENQWRTYRDYKDAHKFRSIYTGTKAISLKGKWLDLDDKDETLLEPPAKRSSCAIM